MKLVAYTRVSTQKQVEEGFGLDVQRDQIQKWAKLNGHRVTVWTSDDGVTGTRSHGAREGLAEALQLVCESEVDGLALTTLDRLARRLHVQEAALGHVWQCGGRVFTVESGEVLEDDPDDPMRTAYRQMRGVFSQLERSMIAKRLRDGRRRKAELGGFAFGAPSYGFMAEAGSLKYDDEEQLALFRMAELRRNEWGVRDIMRTLEREGFPAKRGGHWNPGTLSRIVKRLDAMLEDAPADLLRALDQARLINEDVRRGGDSSDQFLMSMSKQGQGFRVAL